MKLTKQVIREFERDQADAGTEVALYNIIWQLAAEVLRDLGVKGVKTYHLSR